jgi:hypothetical protein
VFLHEPPLEALVRLDAGLVLLWAEGVDAVVVEGVRDAGVQRSLGTDDGDVGTDLLGVGDDGGWRRRIQRLEAGGNLRDAGVAVPGAGVQLGVRVGQRTGNGVLPTTATHEQHGLCHMDERATHGHVSVAMSRRLQLSKPPRYRSHGPGCPGLM